MGQLYSVLQLECVSTEEAEKFPQDAKKWVMHMNLNFANIHKLKNATPYIYIMAMHIPEFLIRYKILLFLHNKEWKLKLNDQTTIDFAKSINHNYHNLNALK